MFFFSCSQKPEDRPSFALLLHELASISDLWIKIRAEADEYKKALYLFYLLIYHQNCHVFSNVSVFMIEIIIQNTKEFQMPGCCTFSVSSVDSHCPFAQVYAHVSDTLYIKQVRCYVVQPTVNLMNPREMCVFLIFSSIYIFSTKIILMLFNINMTHLIFRK